MGPSKQTVIPRSVSSYSPSVPFTLSLPLFGKRKKGGGRGERIKGEEEGRGEKWRSFLPEWFALVPWLIFFLNFAFLLLLHSFYLFGIRRGGGGKKGGGIEEGDRPGMIALLRCWRFTWTFLSLCFASGLALLSAREGGRGEGGGEGEGGGGRSWSGSLDFASLRLACSYPFTLSYSFLQLKREGKKEGKGGGEGGK